MPYEMDTQAPTPRSSQPSASPGEITLTHNPAPIVTPDHSNPDSIEDTPMLEDIPAPASPTASELEYKEDYSDDDSKYDTENEAVPEIAEREIATQVDMGEVIAFTYNEDDMEYETDHGRDMFDDGLSDDESVDSDASTNYEELTEPDIITRLIKVPTTAADNKTTAEDSVEEGSEYISSDEGDSDASEGVADSAPAAVEPDATMTEDVAASIPQRRSLSALLKQDKELSKLLESRDRTLWHLKSIQEQIRQLEAELPIAEACLAEDDKLCESKQYLNEADLEESGISSDLFDAYQNFCESLHPEYGLRDGFSIRCNTPHNGSYVQYDPEFQIFKDCVEMPYDKCNFRCEASLGAIVEFYPIKCPEGLNGEVTWGEQHPELYQLAGAAVRNESETAMEMLINLPDMNSTFDGGWLFEYEFDEDSKDNSIVSRRWRFRSAHKISAPATIEQKRQRIQLLLSPEDVR